MGAQKWIPRRVVSEKRAKLYKQELAEGVNGFRLGIKNWNFRNSILMTWARDCVVADLRARSFVRVEKIARLMAIIITVYRRK